MNLEQARTSDVLASAKLRAELAEVWALRFGVLICENCDHEVIEYHSRLIEMAKKKNIDNPNFGKKYLLKEGYFITVENRRVGRDELTDAQAEEYLKHYPTAIKFFEYATTRDDATVEPDTVPDDFIFPDDLDKIGNE